MNRLLFAFLVAVGIALTIPTALDACDPDYQSCPYVNLWQGPIYCDWWCRNVTPWLRCIQELTCFG